MIILFNITLLCNDLLLQHLKMFSKLGIEVTAVADGKCLCRDKICFCVNVTNQPCRKHITLVCGHTNQYMYEMEHYV